MRRRKFLGVLGGIAAWPVVARGQQAMLPVIGVMRSTSPDDSATLMIPFNEGLREIGYIEGQNVTIDYRAANNVYDRLPAIAADLVRRQVVMIVATGAVSTPLAAKAATSTIPIVFIIGSDPVQHGLVASLGRPSGNITGVTFFSSALIPKRLELLRELVPNARSFGFFVNPNNPNAATEITVLQALAQTGGWTLHVVQVGSDSELDAAFERLAGLRVYGFLLSSDVFFQSRQVRMAVLATRYKLPAIFGRRDAAAAGILISYGARPADIYRMAGTYAGRILKGAKPANLPVQLPTRFETVVNLKAAKAMGVTVPTSILLRADEVIE